MCYSVHISTDSYEDLRAYDSTLVRFERLNDSDNDPCTSLLDFTNQWFVGSKSGCSCSFRHLHSVELGFSDPVDWYEEENDHIDATRQLYATLTKLLLAGYHVDLVDAWYGVQPEEIITLDVSLDEVSRTAFRLFENHKYRLKKNPPRS